jgi:hypothetical protein
MFHSRQTNAILDRSGAAAPAPPGCGRQLAGLTEGGAPALKPAHISSAGFARDISRRVQRHSVRARTVRQLKEGAITQGCGRDWSAASDNALHGAGADAEFSGDLQDAVAPGAKQLDAFFDLRIYARPAKRNALGLGPR